MSVRTPGVSVHRQFCCRERDSRNKRCFNAATATHVDLSLLVPDAEVVDDRGFVEVGQVGNVGCSIKVGRVDTREKVRVDYPHLQERRRGSPQPVSSLLSPSTRLRHAPCLHCLPRWRKSTD